MQQRADQQQRAADDPQEARQAMGTVPVLRAVERPGQLDAHGVALLGLGQIVADDDEHHAHEGGRRRGHVERAAQRRAQHRRAAQHRDHRQDPIADALEHRAHVGLLGIRGQREAQKQVQRRHEQRQGEHRKRAGGIAVGLAVRAPVRGDHLRQPVVYRQPRQDRQQAHDGGQHQLDLILFHARPLLSGSAATAALPPARRR